MPVDPEKIRERIKAVRIRVAGERGQVLFAKAMRLAPSTWNYYERHRVPPVDVLDRIAEVSGAPLLWLIRGDPADFSVGTLKPLAGASTKPADVEIPI